MSFYEDRRISRRNQQQSIVDASMEYLDEEETRDRRRCKGKIERHPPFRIEITEHSIVAVCWFLAPCTLAALLIYVINLLTNWQGVQLFSWTALKDAQAVLGVFTFVIMGALYAGLAWICFRALKALVELFQECSKLIIAFGHGVADIAGKFRRHRVLVAHEHYSVIAEPNGSATFHQVSQNRYNYSIKAAEGLPQLEAPGEAEPPLPDYVLYEEVLSQIPRGHALVGVSGVQTRTRGACRPLLWIVGGSGTGKTNSVVLRVEEDYRRRHGFLVIDPHAFKDDSLFHAINRYEDRFILPMAQETEEIEGVLDWFLEEFKLRKSGHGRYQGPITLLVDEVGSLTNGLETDEEKDVAKKLKEVARLCGQESRGFEMFGVFISQDAAGLAWLRRRASLVIAHQVTMMSERLLVCNQDREVARSMDTWPRGRTYIYGLSMLEGPQVLQQPVVRSSQEGSHETSPHFFLRQNPQNFVDADRPVRADSEQRDTPPSHEALMRVSEQDRQDILAAARLQQDATGGVPVNKTQLILVLREMHGNRWNNNSRRAIYQVLIEAGIPQQ